MENYSGSANVLELRNINQVYKKSDGSDVVVFKEFNLAIEDTPGKGQFIVLMGESGCGKSTLLRYTTGLQKPTSGQILINGKEITPSDRIPMVFQTPSSLEWFTVLQNVALPLTLKGVPLEEARAKAMDMIKIVGLENHSDKYARAPTLSGGQLQRVAIARSLVANPSMILMDEPFSALDAKNRKRMQEFLVQLFVTSEEANLNPTIILVTHDEREAVFVANDILVMGANPGTIKTHIKVDLGVRNELTRKSAKFGEIVNYIEDLI